MPDRASLVVSCEHGSAAVPPRWTALFDRGGRVLETHLAYDRGSTALSRRLAGMMKGTPFVGKVTRLLVDLNRSPGSRTLFSTYSRLLPREEKEALMKRYYRPYRDEVIGEIGRILAAGGSVVHISVHTFAPVVRGSRRPVDIAFLYDPERTRERSFCSRWRCGILKELPSVRLRRNYPYFGTSDGLTRALRGRFPPESYLGLELEVNQRFYAPSKAGNRLRIEKAIATSLASCLRRS